MNRACGVCTQCGGSCRAPFSRCYACTFPERFDQQELARRRQAVNRDTVLTRATSLTERVYLTVPFDEKSDAKRLGACWDTARRMWFVSPHCGDALSRWRRRPNPWLPVPPAAAPRRLSPQA